MPETTRRCPECKTPCRSVTALSDLSVVVYMCPENCGVNEFDQNDVVISRKPIHP
jgi:hypothetical protein